MSDGMTDMRSQPDPKPPMVLYLRARTVADLVDMAKDESLDGMRELALIAARDARDQNGLMVKVPMNVEAVALMTAFQIRDPFHTVQAITGAERVRPLPAACDNGGSAFDGMLSMTHPVNAGGGSLLNDDVNPDALETVEIEIPGVFVLWWSHGDGSSSGVERVYVNRHQAEADCELLNRHSTVGWMVTEVRMVRR